MITGMVIVLIRKGVTEGDSEVWNCVNDKEIKIGSW